MSNIIRRAANGIWHRIDPSPKGQVWRIVKNPPAVRDDEIVFTSSADYTGNPKALFLYMIDHGYNERYKMTWLFEHPENCFEFDIPNVRSVKMFDENRVRTPEAQRAIMSARYVFYSHNVNWAKKFREGQTFVNLWHGCGYKADLKSDKRKIYYDYVMVTGPKYIDVFKEHLRDPDGNILDLGYPRNEFFTSHRSNASGVLNELKAAAGADKAVIWLPTYRKSTVARLDTDTMEGDTGLPVLYNNEELKEFDRHCRDKGVLVILKQHLLQSAYEAPTGELTNVKFIDDKFLLDKGADLYELMAGTDALLTDYSSAAIDYMLLDKPIGYTLDDFDRYEDARGWCLDNVQDYMPGHHIYDIEGLKGFITDVSEGADPHAAWRARIRPEIHTYTEGFSKRILDYFGI